MNKFSILAAIAGLLLNFSNANAGELKTVTLAVDGMTCEVCPITVKRALKKLDGVSDVSAKYEGDNNGWAQVTFDTSKIKVEDLTFATEEAGYPSHVKN